jgi:diaminopimelate decarboxylase
MDFAAAVEKVSGRTVSLVDLGGGWATDDFEVALEPALGGLIGLAGERLSDQLSFLIEPGKAIVEPCQAVLTRVVAIRPERDGSRSVVLDAGIAQVPLARSFPHRLVAFTPEPIVLAAGSDTLLGPSCMESDCVASGVALPSSLAVGDLLAICDVGAYDASMAYAFGRGGPT